MLRRRSLLTLAGNTALLGTTAARAAVPNRPPVLPHERFTFLFITDTHLQPELDADRGCHMAFAKARSIPADFAIQGGDHVFDALGVNAARANMLRDMYRRTADDLSLPVHHTIGNHDCFGVYARSGVQPTDPMYGKKYFADTWGALHYAFDHKGVHVVVLDSIGITADREYEGRIDDAQLAWLKADLASLPAGTPVIVVTHIPLVTSVDQYAPPLNLKHHSVSVANAYDVLPLFDTVNVLAVLQGHTHVLERVDWHGVPYITGGAVSGNWWHGTRLGTPEGFLVVDVAAGSVRTRYETFGFRTIAPQNT